MCLPNSIQCGTRQTAYQHNYMYLNVKDLILSRDWSKFGHMIFSSLAAFISEIICSIAGRYGFNFQPILTRTEVWQTVYHSWFWCLFLPCYPCIVLFSVSFPNFTLGHSAWYSQSGTHSQVCKTAVTHYFSIQKAQKHLNYEPSQHSMDSIVRHFKERGHGRQHKQPSSVGYYLLNVIIGLMFVCLIFEWLPMVKSGNDWRL